MTYNEVFKNVVEWNGLLGNYVETIKGWIKSNILSGLKSLYG